MHVRMYTCTRIYKCRYSFVYIHKYMYIHIHTHLHLYLHMNTCVYIYIYTEPGGMPVVTATPQTEDTVHDVNPALPAISKPQELLSYRLHWVMQRLSVINRRIAAGQGEKSWFFASLTAPVLCRVPDRCLTPHAGQCGALATHLHGVGRDTVNDISLAAPNMQEFA